MHFKNARLFFWWLGTILSNSLPELSYLKYCNELKPTALDHQSVLCPFECNVDQSEQMIYSKFPQKITQ